MTLFIPRSWQQRLFLAGVITAIGSIIGFTTTSDYRRIPLDCRTPQQNWWYQHQVQQYRNHPWEPNLLSLLLSRTGTTYSSTTTQLHAKKEATFGMGCFWKPSEELLKVVGVIDTIVGYTGNVYSKEAPNYGQVCYSRDPWVEGVRVIYDDTQITYKELLNAFFDKQEPKIGSRQYASIIFVHDKEQQTIAEQWLTNNQETVRTRDGLPAVITQIESLPAFYKAEEYHQQYWQKTRTRITGMIVLLAISSGLIDGIVIPESIIPIIHTSANAIVFAASLYTLLERIIDTKTIQI